MKVKASAAWLSKELMCSAEGIKLCGGRCCKTKGFYPPKCSPKFVCPHLTDTGCKFTKEDKPIKCLLYPLVFQKRPDGSLALNLHHRAPCTICKECYKKGGQSILRQQEANLKEIFGAEIVDGMIKAIESGQDYTFDLPEQVEKQLRFEEQEELENIEPRPRSTYNKKDL